MFNRLFRFSGAKVVLFTITSKEKWGKFTLNMPFHTESTENLLLLIISHRKHRKHRKGYYSQKTIFHTESTESTEKIILAENIIISHRKYRKPLVIVYLTQKALKAQKRLSSQKTIFHTEITEITEKNFPLPIGQFLLFLRD